MNCKECGCVGHNTSRCPLSAFEAHRLLNTRLQELENNGLLVLQSQEGIPLYTNMIRGLIDRFIHRNPRVILRHVRPYMDPPSQDPYLFPHLHVQGQVMSDSSSDEFYDVGQHFQGGGGHYNQFYSDDNSQNHTNPPPDFDNQSMNSYTPASLRTRLNLSPSPGRRFGLEPESGNAVRHYLEDFHEPNTSLDLNYPPGQHQLRPTTNTVPERQPPSQASPHIPNSELMAQPFSVSRPDLSTWAQGRYRMLNGYCVPIGPPDPNERYESPPSMSSLRPGTGTLASLVAQGWSLQPPAPDEAGPSNWVARNLQIATMQVQEMLDSSTQQGFLGSALVGEPQERRSTSSPVHDRSHMPSLSIAATTNHPLQVTHNEEPQIQHHDGVPYSPTSPLQLNMQDSASDMRTEIVGDTSTVESQLVLAPQRTSEMFTGKKRRNGNHNRTQSVESYFIFAGDEDQVRRKKRKKRYEEWDAKGGFSLRRPQSTGSFLTKTITDISMAETFEVDPGGFASTRMSKKRIARTSPMESTGNWSLKRSRSNSSSSPVASRVGDHDTEGMECHFSLVVTIADENAEREVVGPSQPPQAP